MITIHQDAPSVNQQTLTICANNAQTYGDPLANATAVELNGFNVRDNLLGSILGRYHTFLIRITWKRSGRKIHYSIPINEIKQVGTPETRYDGLQWHVPMHYWSIDGQPPTGPQPEPKPVAEQVALFDFAEPRRMGGY